MVWYWVGSVLVGLAIIGFILDGYELVGFVLADLVLVDSVFIGLVLLGLMLPGLVLHGLVLVGLVLVSLVLVDLVIFVCLVFCFTNKFNNFSLGSPGPRSLVSSGSLLMLFSRRDTSATSKYSSGFQGLGVLDLNYWFVVHVCLVV